jgi:hypothetical protein
LKDCIMTTIIEATTFRYRGTIKPNNSGFIQRTSVTNANGEPVQLVSDSDIFFHGDDLYDGVAVSWLEEGDELEFELANDTRRQNAYRAKRIRSMTFMPISDGLQITFGTTRIDNPTVPFSWCLKPDVIELMREDYTTKWALVVIAQKKGDRKRKSVFCSAIGPKAIAVRRGYLPFTSEGTYDVAAYLVRNQEAMTTEELTHRLRAMEASYTDSRSQAGNNIWNPDGEDIKRTVHSGVLETVAFCHASVDLPREIFAKPLSAWQRYFANYFTSKSFEDQCMMRRRLLPSIFPGIILILLWEIVKRVSIFGTGIVYFLAGGNPLPVWREMFRLDTFVTRKFEELYQPMGNFKGRRELLRPIYPVMAMLGAWGCYEYPYVALKIVLNIVGFIAFFYCLALVISKLAKQTPARYQAQIDRIETYAVCTADATPKRGPVTVRLVWDGVVRKVCRPYSR